MKTINLAPHDPIPDGPGSQVVVLRRFQEDNPAQTTIQIILTGRAGAVTHPHRPDGTPMHLDEALAAASDVAASEGLAEVYVLDRTQGARETDILGHGGDHSVHMDELTDFDEEDGKRGADMRDIAHPASSA